MLGAPSSLVQLGIFDAVGDFFGGIGDVIGDIASSIGDVITSGFEYVADKIVTGLSNFFGKMLYLAVKCLCYIVNVLYRFFGVFSGTDKVEYDGESQYLINVFFGNKSVNNIYWGMALLGLVLIIAFSIIAVVRKGFDLYGKQQRTYGNIIYTALRSVCVIGLLSGILTASINLANITINVVNDLFNRAEVLDEATSMDFTDEQYATMARIFNTIGNYSLNSSYNSRYNLNSCYNAIRPDLLQLQNEGVFDFYYDDAGGTKRTWQSELQKVVRARDLRYDIKIDDFNTVTPLLDIMIQLYVNKDFHPLAHVERDVVDTFAVTAPIDVVIFLSGTLEAADNPAYNVNPRIDDSVRGPFYTGERSIYDMDDVDDAFDMSLSGISYLLIGLMAVFTIKNLAICVFNCVARVINLLALYIVAPPIAATAVLDDGEKFKQWFTAAVVQIFGIFGNIIPMRLIILIIPIIFGGELNFFPDSGILNMLAKALMLIAGFEAANRFSNVFNGILTGMAGRESASAGDMSGMAAGAVGAVGGFVAGATGVAGAKKAITKTAQQISDKGGILLGPINMYRDKKAAEEKAKKEEAQKSGTLPTNNHK